jgi:hypothetical protein
MGMRSAHVQLPRVAERDRMQGVFEPVAGIVRGSWRAMGSVGAVFALLAIGAGTASADTACTDSWTGAGGDAQWTTAANWSTGAVPAGADHACIAGWGTITVSGAAAAGSVTAGAATLALTGGATLTVADPANDSQVASLTLSGGTLTGAGALHVSSALSWTAGTLSGSGALVLDAGATGTIAPGAGAAVTLDQRTLANHGALTLTSGTLLMNNAASLTNDDILTLDSEATDYGAAVTGDGTIAGAATGTIQKDSGTGTTALAVGLDVSGMLSAATGALQLNAAAGHTAALRDGATLDGVVKLAGATATIGDDDPGTADLRVSGGTASIDGGTTLGARLLTVSGGTLGGAGDVRISRMLTWTGGTLAGSGTTAIFDGAAGYVAPGAGRSVLLDGRTIDNQGTLTLVNGALRGANAGTIANGATLYANSEDAGAFGGTGVLNNSGTVAKTSGSATTAIAWAVTNAGTLDAGSGTLRLSGTTALGSGTQLYGTIALAGPATATGTVDASGAALALPSGGSLAAGTALTVASLSQSGGAITGTGNITINKTLTWTAGSTTGSGTVLLPAGATGLIAPALTTRLSTRTLENHGTLTFNGDPFHLTARATIDNEGTVALAYDGVAIDGSSTSRFINDGTVRKTGGGDATAITIPFDNEGTVDGGSGNGIALAAGGTPNDAGAWAGNVALTGGAFTLGSRTMASGRLTVDGATVTAGSIELSSGTLALASGTLTLADPDATTHVGGLNQSGGTLAGPGGLQVIGALTWSGGTQGGTGTTELADGATSRITGGPATLAARTLRNAGSLSWNAGDVALQDGAALVNDGTLALNAEDAALTCGPRSLIVNTGTLGKDTGTGTTTTACAIDDDGRIAPASGTLTLPGAVHGAAGTVATASATVDCSTTASAAPANMDDLVAALVADPGDPTADAAAWASDRVSYGDPETLVIGESDARVTAYATAHGYSAFASAQTDPAAWLAEQAAFLRGAMADGATIIDLGPHDTASTAVRRPWTTLAARVLLAARGYAVQSADAPYDPATCDTPAAGPTTPPVVTNPGHHHHHHHAKARVALTSRRG